MEKKMKETQPSLKEYSRVYDKIIKNAAKDQFIEMMHTFTGVFIVLTIVNILFEQMDFFDDVIGRVLAYVFGIAIVIFPQILIIIMPFIFLRYSNNKEGFSDAPKGVHRKLIRDVSKKTFFAVLGIYAICLVAYLVFFILDYGFTQETIYYYSPIVVVISLLFSITNWTYKEQISEENFKKIELELEKFM